MPHDAILHLIGLARKAGRLELGEEPVGASCRARQAKLILLASDAAPNTCRRAAHFAQSGGVLFLQLPFTKEELGGQVGRTSCAMLALTDFGFSAALTEKLAQRDPVRYSPAALQLRPKADKVYQRQKEQRQHEKNLQRGKGKPWAPPPKAAAPSKASPDAPKGTPRAPKAKQPFPAKRRAPEEASPPRRPNGQAHTRRAAAGAPPKGGAPRRTFRPKSAPGAGKLTVKSGPIPKK